MLDILIKNGTVIDGSKAPGKKTDIAIEKGKIVQIAPSITAHALRIIDAKDRFVTPGFVDIQNHSDSYWTILDQPGQVSLLSQGVTTIVMGNCGSSLAPLLSRESIKSIQKWHSLSGVNINWTSMDEFLKFLVSVPKGVNVATLVGHATLRRGLVGDSIQTLSETDLNTMRKVLNDALNQGALGLSMGLVYAHEANSSAEELRQVTSMLKSSAKYLSVHLRSEASHILESVDEVLQLASEAGVAIKISHLKIRGKNNWSLFDRLTNKLELAYHQGLNVSFDVYPYSTAWTVLYTYLPKWAYEGGRPQILKMISDPPNRRKILDFIKSQGHDFQGVIISEAQNNQNLVGKTLKQLGESQSVSPEEALLNVISATSAQVSVFDHNLSSEQVELLCFSPLSFIASDGAGYNEKSDRLVHPRCFGAFTRFLRMVREKKIIKWEMAINKLTHEPFKLLGLNDRGLLKVGNYADIAVFNPQTVTDHADYKNPDLFSSGIDLVLVNGQIAYADSKLANLNGQVLTR